MIREVCSCGAEFETDVPEQIMLAKSWRRTHKHSNKPSEGSRDGITLLSDNQVALGFQAIYDPLQGDSENGNN